jgi:hypothetical protein
MRSFISACAVAIVIAVGCAVVLDYYNKPVDIAFASPTGVRI